MHYSRTRRHGEAGPATRLIAPHGLTLGYAAVADPDHPLVRVNGTVLVHRKVLFAKIGPGPHRCHWCGLTVVWWPTDAALDLVGDHLDNDITNNDPANLVAACSPCNSTRGRRAMPMAVAS